MRIAQRLERLQRQTATHQSARAESKVVHLRFHADEHNNKRGEAYIATQVTQLLDTARLPLLVVTRCGTDGHASVTTSPLGVRGAYGEMTLHPCWCGEQHKEVF